MLWIKPLCLRSVLLDCAVPDIGVLISHVSFSCLRSPIQDVVSHGATLVTGGNPYHHSIHIMGHYFCLTLITNATLSMRIIHIELLLWFSVSCARWTPPRLSPLPTQYRIPWEPARSGMIPGPSGKSTLQIKAGIVVINDSCSYYAVQLPFGGVKGSGYGHFRSRKQSWLIRFDSTRIAKAQVQVPRSWSRDPTSQTLYTTGYETMKGIYKISRYKAK